MKLLFMSILHEIVKKGYLNTDDADTSFSFKMLASTIARGIVLDHWEQIWDHCLPLITTGYGKTSTPNYAV